MRSTYAAPSASLGVPAFASFSRRRHIDLRRVASCLCPRPSAR